MSLEQNDDAVILHSVKVAYALYPSPEALLLYKQSLGANEGALQKGLAAAKDPKAPMGDEAREFVVDALETVIALSSEGRKELQGWVEKTLKDEVL